MATENKENEGPKQTSAKVTAKETTKASAKKTTGKRKSTDMENDESKDQKSAPAPKKAKTTTATKSKDAKDALPDVSDIQLPGDMEDEAPIYATATDIRRMLNSKLKEAGASQAKFCKMASQACGKKISTHQLATFREKAKKKGSNAVVEGTDSPVFYAAWCYFEKLRMKDGKAKSKHQLEMEEAHGGKGMPRRGNKPLILHSSEHASYDKLGRLVIQGPDGKVNTL